MKKGMMSLNLNRTLAALLALILLPAADRALARDNEGDGLDYRRYVIELIDPPLALYDGGELSVEDDNGPMRMAATAPEVTGESKLNLRSAASMAYLEFLAARQADFAAEVRLLLGRDPDVSYRYRNATNGLALILTPDEADVLAESPLVRSIAPDVVYRLDTYAGPEWIGAGVLWNGDAGFPAARGEGVVVGNIDTGINWNHPSFSDSGHNYVNPYGEGLGLCSDPEVLCNEKLVGVYDFVEDDPSTEDWVEENTKGEDNDGHGSHTAGISVGMPVSVTINGGVSVQLSGVAPHAHLVSYRVCYKGEPQTADSEGCSGSAIMAAIDQAVTDGVDVINYSIGGDPRDPWGGATAERAFLGARAAGIFVASSAGNTGPNEATVTSPALAPWITAVGNASHNAVLGNTVQDFSGGSLPAPETMVGASRTDGTSKLVIVHARDYGNALCGEGEPELQANCADNTGASNPWKGEKPFNGEIVVCDRGTYGRVEKGKNVLQAGAGGYILANTSAQGESIVADEHCLPASHIGAEDGDELRAWLAAGSGHGARITGQQMVESDGVADQLSFSSSRGPAIPPVEDTLKPNVIAPGTAIVAAGFQASSFLTLSGTSMASPHVAGAAALIKSVQPDWGASQLASTIEMTATTELARDENGDPATTEQVGAGRPQLGLAAQAGLYLDVTGAEFEAANPVRGGSPRALNLPGVVDASCKGACSFSRTVTDLMGGGSWTATPVDFPPGTQVTVSPTNFTLANRASRDLLVTVNAGSSGVVGDWVSGRIRLSAAGSPDLYLTVSVYSYGGDLPENWPVVTSEDSGWTTFGLNDLVALPNASFQAGGPVRPQTRTETRVEDPTNDDPYNDVQGVFTHWYNLPDGALWLFAETLQSTAEDLDLFVGRDVDGDGRAEEWEELCSSTTPQDLERCDLFDLPPGSYWIQVQNWTGTNPGGDEMTLRHFAVQPSTDSGLAASGPGIVGASAAFPVRLSWDNFSAAPGETWFGAVGIASSADRPNNIGVIPVTLQREGVAGPQTLPLMNGRTHGFALAGNGNHDRAFIDIPPGASGLTVAAAGANASQSDALTLELVRRDFDQAFSEPPFAAAAGDGPVLGSASGAGGNGPIVAVAGGVIPGRWYAVVRNGSGEPVSVSLRADVSIQGEAIEIHRGLWFPPARSGQGFDYNWGGTDRALIWYTYDEQGLPAWYIGGAASVDGNIWTSDLFRVTNDGSTQQLAPVGSVSVTMLAPGEALFSYTLFGRSGTERVVPLSPQTCPQAGGGPASYTGIWYRGVAGLGGASVLVNANTQAQIHYLFDELGLPRWLFAQDLQNPDPLASSVPILQFSGYCAVCAEAPVTNETVGVLGLGFDSDTAGFWTLDYLMDAPLNGDVERTDQVIKLTDTLGCP